MRAYIIRRLLLMIPTLFLVTVIVFLLIRFIPGDVIDLMVAEMSEEGGAQGAEFTANIVRKALGLDVPIHVQYTRWIGGVFQGDLGVSLWTKRSVLEDILRSLPITVELAVFALTTALLIALPIGTYSAIRQDTGGDYIGRSFAILCISIPNFWLATLIMIYPSIWWNWAPPMEYIALVDDPGGNLLQFILPGFLMGMVMSGTTMRLTRTMMLEVLRQDYIRTAWAKGLRERTVVLRHALKNAFIPVISMIGILFAGVLGGSVIIESIFNLPGIGRLLIGALSRRDYPIISGINLVIASWVFLTNLVTDITYGFLDPRIQFK